MTGDAIAGDLKGTRLEELPLGEKTQWKDWVDRHPDTDVLSVDGREHIESNPYDNYFSSDSGFRGTSARDGRLDTKDPIYSFHLNGKAYAVPFKAYEGGAVFRIGERDVFLYRPKGVAIYYSTLAFQAAQGAFVRRADGWYHGSSGARLEPDGFAAAGGTPTSVSRIDGFDTFWYMWSLTNPATEILKPLASSQ
jgi:hypothetical protein